MLESEEAAEREIEGLAARIAPARMAVEGMTPGVRIGPYRLVREIGRGGMGTVFLAERDDGQYRQRVALKLLRLGATSEEAHARFRAMVKSSLGEALAARRQRDEAGPLLTEAVATLRTAHGEDHDQTRAAEERLRAFNPAQ